MRTLLKTLYSGLQRSPEVPITLYLFGLMYLGPINEQYIYTRYSKEYGYNYTINGGSSSNCDPNGLKNSTNRILQTKIQGKVAEFMNGASFCQYLPPVLMCVFYGPLSDRIGRVPIIFIGLLAAFMGSIVALVVAVCGLHVKFLYLGSFFIGMGGNYLAVVLAVSGYVSDVTEGKGRALRLAILELLVFLGIMISNYTSGIFLEKFGFVSSYVFVICLIGISLLECAFILKESLDKENRLPRRNYCTLPADVFQVIKKSRPLRWKLHISLAILVLTALPGPAANLSTLMLYLINLPLCMSPGDIGYYRGTFFFIIGVGAVLGVLLFRMIKSTSLAIGISILSLSAYLIFLSFCKTTVILYIGILPGIFCSTAQAVLKGEMSQLVSGKEQGALFAFIGSITALVVFVGSLMYQSFYKYSNSQGKPGVVFQFGGVFCIVPLIFVLVFYIKERQMLSREKSDNNNENEDAKSNRKLRYPAIPEEEQPLIA